MTKKEFRSILSEFSGHFDSIGMFSMDTADIHGIPHGPHRFADYGYWKGSDKKGRMVDDILLYKGHGKKFVTLVQPVSPERLREAMLEVGFAKKRFEQMRLF